MQGMSPENTLYLHYKKKLVNVIYRRKAVYCENLVKQNNMLCSFMMQQMVHMVTAMH